MIRKNQLASALLFCFSIAINGQAQTCKTDVEIPPTTPTSRFEDKGDGTVTDNQTGLMWAKCSEGLSGAGCATGVVMTVYNWQDAMNLAEGNSLAGYSDWRLPNIKELQSIIERQCWSPSINLAVFPNTRPSLYWSNSPYGDDQPYYAWLVNFESGYASHSSRNSGMNVRLVRSGK